ncbi:MAG: dihydroxy-acid dehydratase [Candidatus Sumerlaeota bacterium]|nr:dihydroxy-acid dehydratase [Candidatus Sumerlaeota bacterium]
MKSDTIKKGRERAPHRSLLRACGLKDEDFDKPFVAIVGSHVDCIPGHVHLNAVNQYIKKCLIEAGAAPFVFNTIGIDDGIAMGHSGMKYSLPSRELIADSVESMLEAHCFDAMICIPNCDKIVPGMMMAAARVNIPTVIVSGGPMEAGSTATGKKVDLISVFTGVAQRQVGAIDDETLLQYEKCGCPTCGSCSGMFTANSMNCLNEALGLSLPGNGTILATSIERKRLYKRAAEALMECIEKDIKPRDIITLASLENAMALDMAMGGSTNTLLHTLAVAREAGIAEFNMGLINDLSRRVPNICKVSPSSDYHVEDVHRAGGIYTILGELARSKPDALNLDCMTVTGKTLGKNIKEYDLRSPKCCKIAKRFYAMGCAPTKRSVQDVEKMLAAKGEKAFKVAPLPPSDEKFNPLDCIRTVERAYSQSGGLTILYGNLAQDGCVVKTAGVDPKMLAHTGPAVIFESQEDACEGILGGKVKAGDVVVIRNEGPRGGPGMQEMLSPTSYIKGMNLGDQCALITDGRFSGGTAGACIGHISPEAAEGGNIGLLRDGDIIEIDIPNQKINVRLSDAELHERRAGSGVEIDARTRTPDTSALAKIPFALSPGSHIIVNSKAARRKCPCL